jgi:hypothetical protein
VSGELAERLPDNLAALSPTLDERASAAPDARRIRNIAKYGAASVGRPVCHHIAASAALLAEIRRLVRHRPRRCQSQTIRRMTAA